MPTFRKFKEAVERQLQVMAGIGQLFRVNIPSDLVWETYLKSFPEGTNPIYRERTEHDCSCCRQFIRNIGNVVAIKNGQLMSVWDIDINSFHQDVANALAALVRTGEVNNYYMHYEPQVGTDFNHEVVDGVSKKWEHLSFRLPAPFVMDKRRIDTRLGEMRSSVDVFKRGLEELTPEAIDTVRELIAQGSLYRGEEHKSAVDAFHKHQKQFIKANKNPLYAWENAAAAGAISRIRNTSIGTLLVDLSSDMDLDAAVRKFEAMVAPANYKRPTSLITKAMIEKAQKTVQDLGLESALARRFAVAEDLTINNVIFADRSVRPAMNAFEELAAAVPDKKKNFDKVDEVSIEDFIKDIVPTAKSISVLFENKHKANLVSLIAPVDKDAGSMLKWGNNFSWDYEGGFTDAIKERVKAAGGNVTGDVCCRLAWDYTDDLDFHMIEPDKYHIYFGNKRVRSNSGGMLDVDANGGDGLRANPVENIFYAKKSTMKEGKYQLKVNNYSRRSEGVGFEIEIEIEGTQYNFTYDKVLRGQQTIDVAEIEYSKKDGFKVTSKLESRTASKQVWNVATQTLVPVTMIMNSPNHWDGEQTGNKHWFFMMKDCLKPEPARGFFNEFLKNDLDQHRKVFEMLGNKMKTPESTQQLSGLGFSSTVRNQLVVKVDGTFSRTLKVNF